MALYALRQVNFRQHAAHAAAAESLDGGDRYGNQCGVTLQSTPLLRIQAPQGSTRKRDDGTPRRCQLQDVARETVHLRPAYIEDLMTGRKQPGEDRITVIRLDDALSAHDCKGA